MKNVRIHDLRHSFASRALALGLTLPMIGRLLGHTDIGSTARYAHLSRDAEKIAVARVGDSIEADIVLAESEAHADGQTSAAEPAGGDGGNGRSAGAMAQA